MNISLENLKGTASVGRRLLVVPTVLGLSLMVAACDDGDDAAAPGSGQPAGQVDEFDGLTEVDAGEFDLRPRSDLHAFDFRTGGNVVGLCLAEDGKVSCLGKPDASAPDATKSLPGRPNGIELTGGAVEFVNYDFTGGIPPEKELVAGQKVSFGSVTCGMVDDSTLKCRDEGAWFSVTGADRTIETGDAGKTAGSASGEGDASAKTGPRKVKDVSPEKFGVNDTGKNAWVLEDGKSICWVMEEGSYSSGVSCTVQLKNPPKDPTFGTPATKLVLSGTGEAALSPDISGYTPFDYQTLGANERVSLRGVTCTAHGGSDFVCEAGGTTVEIKDGKTPDIPVVDGMGGGSPAEANSRGSRGDVGGIRTSGFCGSVTSAKRPKLSGDVQVRDGRVDCDEVMPIVKRYIETSADAEHGMENWRFYGDWTCKNPRELRGGTPRYLVSCSTDDGHHVAIGNPDWRP